MRALAFIVCVVGLACGRTPLDPLDLDGGAPDAGLRLRRCFPNDALGLPLACPDDSFCKYAWGNGPPTVECEVFPPGCQADRTCDCLVNQPPTYRQFCGGTYCSTHSDGLLVFTCAPD